MINNLDKSSVKISVLMPVYNTTEEYLRAAIESILNQTYKDFEFIIINDGSTINNVKDVIFSYNDERIIYIENETNLGLIKTLNKGISLTKGEYIARMDSDDISKPKRLEVMLDFMEKNPDVGAVGSHALATPINYKYATPCENAIITTFLRYIANCVMHPTVIIRKSILEKYKLKYDEKYIHCEDYKLWIEVDKYSRLANIPEVLLIHRVYDEAVSVKYADIQKRISSKILWENIIEEFERYNFFLRNAVKKYFSDKKLNLFDMIAVIFSIKKMVKHLKKKLTPDFYSYIESTYKSNFINFIKVVPAGRLLVALIWVTDIMEILGYSEDDKITLTRMILKQAKKEQLRGK